jgi:hypothetical protein
MDGVLDSNKDIIDFDKRGGTEPSPSRPTTAR